MLHMLGRAAHTPRIATKGVLHCIRLLCSPEALSYRPTAPTPTPHSVHCCAHCGALPCGTLPSPVGLRRPAATAEMRALRLRLQHLEAGSGLHLDALSAAPDPEHLRYTYADTGLVFELRQASTYLLCVCAHLVCMGACARANATAGLVGRHDDADGRFRRVCRPPAQRHAPAFASALATSRPPPRACQIRNGLPRRLSLSSRVCVSRMHESSLAHPGDD